MYFSLRTKIVGGGIVLPVFPQKDMYQASHELNLHFIALHKHLVLYTYEV